MIQLEIPAYLPNYYYKQEMEYLMNIRDYNELRSFSRTDYNKQIILPPAEYAMVMSEFNSNMSDEERKHRVVSKAIGDYWYTVLNQSYNEYIVINKTPIEDLDNIKELWKEID